MQAENAKESCLFINNVQKRIRDHPKRNASVDFVRGTDRTAVFKVIPRAYFGLGRGLLPFKATGEKIDRQCSGDTAHSQF